MKTNRHFKSIYQLKYKVYYWHIITQVHFNPTIKVKWRRRQLMELMKLPFLTTKVYLVQYNANGYLFNMFNI